jgi:hypothetical protein
VNLPIVFDDCLTVYADLTQRATHMTNECILIIGCRYHQNYQIIEFILFDQFVAIYPGLCLFEISANEYILVTENSCY